MCYNFSQFSDIIFNSLKSVYIVSRPKRYKLFCPIVSLHLDRLNRIPENIYLGYLLCEDQSDDEDVANQMRLSTYGLINYYECLVIVLLISRWNCLEVIVKYEDDLLYCCSLWSDYRKTSYKSLSNCVV